MADLTHVSAALPSPRSAPHDGAPGPGGIPRWVAVSATGEVGRVIDYRGGRALVQFETWEGPQRTLRLADRWIPIRRLRPA